MRIVTRPSASSDVRVPQNHRGSDDEGLFEQFRQGDEGALEELMARYARQATGYLVSRCRDRHAAEDILQDVWLCISNARHSFQGERKFRSWFYSIVHRRLCDLFRYQSRHRIMSFTAAENETGRSVEESIPGRDMPIVEALIRTEEAKKAGELITRLPEALGVPFHLRHVDAIPYREIAQRLKISEEIARIRVHKALTELREKMVS